MTVRCIPSGWTPARRPGAGDDGLEQPIGRHIDVDDADLPRSRLAGRWHAGDRNLVRQLLEEPRSERLPGVVRVLFAPHRPADDPVGRRSVAVTVATLVACWSGPATRRRWLLIAALSAIGVMVTYPIFFAGTNEAFVRGGLSDSAVRSLLDRWATWHWIRTSLGILGFFAASRALQRS